MEQNQVEQIEFQMLQRKVSGFDKAIFTYRKLVKESNGGVGVLSKRKEEYIDYVKRMVFNDGTDTTVHLPDLETQHRVVARMKDLN